MLVFFSASGHPDTERRRACQTSGREQQTQRVSEFIIREVTRRQVKSMFGKFLNQVRLKVLGH